MCCLGPLELVVTKIFTIWAKVKEKLGKQRLLCASYVEEGRKKAERR